MQRTDFKVILEPKSPLNHGLSDLYMHSPNAINTVFVLEHFGKPHQCSFSVDEATECIRAVWTSWHLRSNGDGNGGNLLSDLDLGAAMRTTRPFSSKACLLLYDMEGSVVNLPLSIAIPYLL